MSCCVDPDSVIALAKDNNASRDELLLASRPLGDGLLQVDLSVPAAHCGACITTIESALKRLPVVEQARVNLTSRRVSCIWRETVDGKPSDPTVILDALTGCGYRGHLFTAAAEEDDKARTRLLQAVGLLEGGFEGSIRIAGEEVAKLDPHGRTAPARSEDDHLEIPAFLRRQAN